MNFKMCILIFSFLVGVNAHAQAHVEFEYSRSSLTAGLDSWNDINIRNYFSLSPDNNQMVLESDYKNHFNEGAFLLGGTLTHSYSDLWYQDLSLTWASNPRAIAQFIVFSEIHRKLLSDQSLVAGFGLGYAETENPYHDTYALFEATYYPGSLISYQAGMRVNQSHPGSVTTARFFAILNFLKTESLEGFLKIETGREGYTVISANNFKNEFRSTEETVQVHRWFNSKYGMGVNLDLYQGAFYNRTSVALSFLMRY